jgi:nitroimidazol reductase NimA-like FMN-containing flavoprotein (pyridoxamine 5'-phosphate oxidase superfamily)
MVVHEMTAQECRALLARMNLARLACAANNQPYVVPIHVDFHRDYLYGFATEGLKIEWMRQNPLVCLEMDDFSSQTHWASVVVFGHYEELPPVPEYEDLRRLAEELFQKHPMWWQPASVPLPGHEQRPSIVYRIRIDRMTGRRSSDEPVKTPANKEIPSEVVQPGWLTRILRRLSWMP